MLAVFIVAWCVAAASWFYTMRFFFPMWLAGFRHREEHIGYPRQIFIGTTIFVASIGVGFAAGGIANYGAGGW